MHHDAMSACIVSFTTIHMSACYELASFYNVSVCIHVVTDACMLAYSHTVAIAIAIYTCS